MASPSAFTAGSRGPLATFALAGSQARIEGALQGAHLLTWEPVHTRPVLFVSPRSHYAPGKAIRGGVPLVFPWFGPNAGNPHAAQHGFARVRDWRTEAARIEADGSAFVAQALTDDEHTRAGWPHAFAAVCSVRANRELQLALEIRNTGATSCTFEAAFHTYFAVSDVRHIAVHGLAGTEYVERAAPAGRHRQGVAPIKFAGEVDRTYLDTLATCVIDDPGWKRRIVVAKTGSRTTVVWNPGAEKARAMADLGDPAWIGFVCVETVCAGDDAVTLAPGATHTLGASISVEQD